MDDADYEKIDKLMPEVYKSWVCYGDIVRWVYSYMGTNDFTLYLPHVIKDGVHHYFGINCDNKDFNVIKYKLRDLLRDRNDYAKIEFTDLTLFVINFMKTMGYASLYGDVLRALKSNIASDRLIYDDYLKFTTNEYFMKVDKARYHRSISLDAVEPYGVTLDIIYDIVKDRDDYDKLDLIDIKDWVDEYNSNTKGEYCRFVSIREIVDRYFKTKYKFEMNVGFGEMVKKEIKQASLFDRIINSTKKPGIPVATKEEVLCVCTVKDAIQLGATCNITREDSDRNSLGLILATYEKIPGKNEFQLTTHRRFINVDRFRRGNWGDKPIYLKFSHAFELMKAGFRCSPLLHQEYEYCFGIKNVDYKTVDGVELTNQSTPGIVIMQFLSQKAVGISSPIPPTIDNFTMGMMLDEWKVV